MASNCHPDHDTICAFRHNNFEAVAKAFEQVLLLAKELKLLRLGTVSVDGTKVDANANKRNSIRYDRAQALTQGGREADSDWVFRLGYVDAVVLPGRLRVGVYVRCRPESIWRIAMREADRERPPPHPAKGQRDDGLTSDSKQIGTRWPNDDGCMMDRVSPAGVSADNSYLSSCCKSLCPC